MSARPGHAIDRTHPARTGYCMFMAVTGSVTFLPLASCANPIMSLQSSLRLHEAGLSSKPDSSVSHTQ